MATDLKLFVFSTNLKLFIKVNSNVVQACMIILGIFISSLENDEEFKTVITELLKIRGKLIIFFNFK